MKYVIVSIDDKRAVGKAAIREAMHNHDEVEVVSTNGYDPISLKFARQMFPDLELEGSGLSLGELGCWYSQLFCWKWSAEHGPLIVIEDDAIVSPEFDDAIAPLLADLPADYDYLNLHVPSNQLQDFSYRTVYDINGAPKQFISADETRYNYTVEGSECLAKTYQGYSTAANIYSQNGARRLLEQAKFRKIAAPVDIFIYQDTHLGNLNGYAHRPDRYRPVTVDHSLPAAIIR